MVEFTPEGDFALSGGKRLFKIDLSLYPNIEDTMIQLMWKRQEVSLGGEMWYIIAVSAVEEGDDTLRVMVSKEKSA